MQCFQRPSSTLDLCEPERRTQPSPDISNADLQEQMLTWGELADSATMLCGPEPLEVVAANDTLGHDTLGHDAGEVDLGRGDTGSLLGRLAGLWGSALTGQVDTDDKSEEQAKPSLGASGYVAKKGKDAERGQADIQKYEARIAEHRARLAKRALGEGPDAEAARAELEKLGRIDTAHKDFSEVDLGNGQTVPVPYMVNYKTGIWPGRKTGNARKTGDKALRGGGVSRGHRRSMQIGKGSAEANEKVLQGLLKSRPWEKLPKAEARSFRRKLAKVAPKGVSGAALAAWEVIVYCQMAGYGTDCSGYVHQMLEKIGAVRASKVRTGVGGLTKLMGKQVDGTVARGRGKASVARPVDASGNLVVRSGDMMRMAGGGHIGLVHDVVDTGTEVILKVAHSTPGQAVYGTTGRMGSKTEGLREDIITWDRKTQRWKAVRSFMSSSSLNAPGRISGFFRADAGKADKRLTRWEAGSKRKR